MNMSLRTPLEPHGLCCIVCSPFMHCFKISNAYFADNINHNVHSPDALVQNMYGNTCSTAAICKGQSDSRSNIHISS